MLFPEVIAKVTVLLAIAAMATFLMRKNSASSRHLVWGLALTGILGVFAVSSFAPSFNVVILPAIETKIDSNRVAIENESRAQHPKFELNESEKPNPQTLVNSATTPLESPASNTKNSPVSNQPLVKNFATQSSFSIRDWFEGIWLVGLVVCIVPLIVGLIRIEYLKRECRPIVDTTALNLLKDCRTRLAVRRSVTFLELNDERPPMTSGVFQVNIFLPAIWREWSNDQLNCVLMHELAHIKRLDVAWYLLGRTACSVFWFHPLAWFGLHRLKVEREVASDDLVIATGQRATDYASKLLAVARACLFSRPLVGGIAMTQSIKLENRIRQLLDPSLAHGSVSTKGRLSMLAMSILLVVAIGTIQPVAKSNEAATVTASETSADDSIQFSGVVLSPDGKPVGQAAVTVSVYSDGYYEKVSRNVTSDPEGKFSFEIQGTDFKETNGKLPDFHGVATATSDEFAFGASEKFDSKSISEIKVNLVKAGRPFKGQIVDQEGDPVSGATVKLIGIATPKNDKISTFIESIPKAYEARDLEKKHLTFSAATAHIPVVKTGEDGWFELKNIGEERMLMLRIDGASIKSNIINVLPTKMKTKSLPDYAGTDLGTTIYYGYDFRHAAVNSVPVTGRVVDIESGKPISGVKIKTKRHLGGSVFVHWLEATSDDSGKFSIMGIPSGQSAKLIATIDDQPYFDQNIRLPKDARSVDVKLKKGIWITGRVTNEEGEPVESAVFYFVNDSNPNRKSAPGFAGGMERGWIVQYYMTKKDGSFRRVGFPGEGVIAVRATGADAEPYPLGAGTEDIEGGRSMGNQKMLSTYPSQILTNNFHRLIPVAPKKGEKSVEQNVVLNRDKVLSGKVVDNAGKPLKGFLISGNKLMGGWSYRPSEKSSFDLYGYDPDKPRQITLMHEERKLAGTIFVEGREPSELVIKLQPWSTITGRIVDEEGSPMPGVIISSLPNQSPTQLPRGKFRTDQEGRFRIEGLASGAPYGISVRRDDRLLKVSVVEDIKLEPSEEKDLGDLKIESN